MSGSVAAAPTRYLLVETVIGTAINAALTGLFTLLIFSGHELSLWGPGGLAIDFIPSTFLPVLAMTIGMTVVTRQRRRSGRAPVPAGPALAVPHNAVLRGLLFAAAATILLGGAGLFFLTALWTPQLSFPAVLAFKLLYGAAVGLIMAPIIVTAALRDPVNR